MKAFNGFEEAKKAAQFVEGAKLPEGAYIAKIMGVKFEEGTNGNSDRIAIQFDIAEGEQKDFFKTQYENNTNEDKKWKGATRIFVPTDDGSEKDGWTKNTFAKWTNALEGSNPGYVWDWDENKWKGKTIGLVFRSCGNVIDGKEVTYTEVAFPIEAATVREGKAPTAKFKAYNGFTGMGTKTDGSGSNDGFMNIPANAAEEIPF